jgi:hypothetical protein
LDSLISFGGDDGHGRAVPGGTWDWDTIVGDPLQGWRFLDVTANKFVSFGRHTASDFQQHGDPCQPVPAGTASLWCGAHQDQATSLDFVAGMGYGNSQDQRAYSPSLTVNSPGDAVDISFTYFNDAEGAAGDTLPIAAFDGIVGDPAHPALFNLRPRRVPSTGLGPA